MTTALNQLDALGKTAWLTAYCHSRAGRQHGLVRPVSDWLIALNGSPPFADKIAERTLHGVSMRAKTMDAWLDEILVALPPSTTATVVSLGAGFDSRWHGRLGQGKVITRWIEVDRPHVLDAKRNLLHGSQFSSDYDLVEQVSVDLTGDIAPLIDRLDGPVIVIAEGVLDYLPLAHRSRILMALRKHIELKAVILDAQNAFFQRLANRESEKNTGDRNVRFVDSPRNPEKFFKDLSLAVEKRHSPLPALAAISSTIAERAAIKFVPMIRDGYQFLWLA